MYCRVASVRPATVSPSDAVPETVTSADSSQVRPEQLEVKFAVGGKLPPPNLTVASFEQIVVPASQTLNL